MSSMNMKQNAERWCEGWKTVTLHSAFFLQVVAPVHMFEAVFWIRITLMRNRIRLFTLIQILASK
jgi:hypothetical protein